MAQQLQEHLSLAEDPPLAPSPRVHQLKPPGNLAPGESRPSPCTGRYLNILIHRYIIKIFKYFKRNEKFYPGQKQSIYLKETNYKSLLKLPLNLNGKIYSELHKASSFKKLNLNETSHELKCQVPYI